MSFIFHSTVYSPYYFDFFPYPLSACGVFLWNTDMSSNCIIIVEYYVLIILCTYFVSFSFYKGRAWAEKASRYRPSVWKVGTKRPGITMFSMFFNI